MQKMIRGSTVTGREYMHKECVAETTIDIFEDIVETYNLKTKIISENEVAFVSSNYVLVIFIEHFGISISYSTKEELPDMYYCDDFFAEAYDDEDRKGLEAGEDAKTRIRNELIVASRGLVSKWENVLKGDTTWIEDFKKSMWYSKHSQPKVDSSIFKASN